VVRKRVRALRIVLGFAASLAACESETKTTSGDDGSDAGSGEAGAEVGGSSAAGQSAGGAAGSSGASAGRGSGGTAAIGGMDPSDGGDASAGESGGGAGGAPGGSGGADRGGSGGSIAIGGTGGTGGMIGGCMSPAIELEASASSPCSFVLPDEAIDINRINVRIGNEPVCSVGLGATCNQEGWAFSATPREILLCPRTCEALDDAPDPTVFGLFGCFTVPCVD
jgi:hypothetical protein